MYGSNLKVESLALIYQNARVKKGYWPLFHSQINEQNANPFSLRFFQDLPGCRSVRILHWYMQLLL